MPRDSSRIDFVDHLRGLAIALVFGFHARGEALGTYTLPWAGWFPDFTAAPFPFLFPFTYGWAGVPMFFVISGFCIHLSHERARPKSFRAFFVRRFFRLYPPYVAAIALLALLVLPPASLSARDLLTHLLLVYNFDEPTYFSINGSFWTIALEAQLYCLYPLVALVGRRLGWNSALWMTGVVELSLRGCAVLFLRMQDTLFVHPLWLFHGPLMFWFSWTLGAKLAHDFLNGQFSALSRIPIYVWPLLTVAGGVLKPVGALSFVLVALSTERAISGLLRSPSPPAFLAHPLAAHLRVAGLASYSVYLIHQPLLAWLHTLLFSLHGGDTHPLLTLLYGMVAWVPILGIGWLLYRLVELPSIDAGKRLVTHMSS